MRVKRINAHRAGLLHQVEPVAVVVAGNAIAAIGPDAGAAHPGIERIDARNAVVMPGLINAHLHSNEGFEQGAYDNLPLEPWLLQSYPPFGFPLLSEDDYYLRTMVAAVESIRSGVTTVQDDYVHLPGTPEAQDAAIQAYLDAGAAAEAFSEFEACQKRRGEGYAVFLDDIPTARLVTPIAYWMGRAHEGMGLVPQARADYQAFTSAYASGSPEPLLKDAAKRLAK